MLTMSNSTYVQRFDAVPQFWQFLRGLRFEDLIIELIQNDLDANATHTTIAFRPDRLVCQGDGEPVTEDGWERLSYVMGAGDQVQRKKFCIGVKNHGLKACFRLGDDIILRSDGQRMTQTLYKDGTSSPPSPGTLAAPVPDSQAPATGCVVEVPYRQHALEVPAGETLLLAVADDKVIDELFHKAYEQLPRRLLGIVRPRLRTSYVLNLHHHVLGSVEIHWTAKRGRNIRGRNRRKFFLFKRECHIRSHEPTFTSTTIYEQAATFPASYPPGIQPELPDFFRDDEAAFLMEIAWSIDKNGKPRATRGVRRYPIAYDGTNESARTGVGINFTGPYISDAERHGASQVDQINDHLDSICADAVVDVMAAYLLRRHGGKAMSLFISSHASTASDTAHNLVELSVNRGALPLRGPTPKSPKPSHRRALGPRRISRGGRRRVVLPMFTWANDRVSRLLSAICPESEDQIDSTVPRQILRYLAHRDDSESVVTFDENDAIDRLKPQQETRSFPWRDESEWQRSLGNPEVAKRYLDVVYESIENGDISRQDQEEIRQFAFLPDQTRKARCLTTMFRSVSLPPNLKQRHIIPILYPMLQNHKLLKRRAWKPKLFTLEDYLDEAKLEKATDDDRRSFWSWLRRHGRSIDRRTLTRLTDLPVWPSADGRLLRLDALCRPQNRRVASILGDAIVRPSGELLRAGVISKGVRGRLKFRHEPTIQEIESFLDRALADLPHSEPLRRSEVRKFHRFEDDLAYLASHRQLRKYVSELSANFATALSFDGVLCPPGDLVRYKPSLLKLHLLPRHIIDRPNRRLDRIDGWRPKPQPTTAQLRAALLEDASQVDAHIPRLDEYRRQAKNENIRPDGLFDVPCIPRGKGIYRPTQLALAGRPDYWGDWKIEMPVATISTAVQRLYKHVGVLGGTPDLNGSRDFFQWLASQSSKVIERHIDQILRHISHRMGPQAWADEFPSIAFIPVHSNDGSVQLVTMSEATKANSTVAIPDLDPLEKAIEQSRGKRPVKLVIVSAPQVKRPITPQLGDLGVRSLSYLAGEPRHVLGKGVSQSPLEIDVLAVLESLRIGTEGRQIHKRLSNLGLDGPKDVLRKNWREGILVIRQVLTAESVTATYILRRRRYSISVDGGLDKTTGTLWIRSNTSLTDTFYDVLAAQVFELPKKYHGPVLERACNMDLRERKFTGGGSSEPGFDDDEVHNTLEDGQEDIGVAEAMGSHSSQKRVRSEHLPNPGSIPTGPGSIRNVNKKSLQKSRRIVPVERLQIDDLKENQYAWHCQACLTQRTTSTLAPTDSYASHLSNRSSMMHAHHCDQRSAGGARHVGNILLLCRFHHDDLGDEITRFDVATALRQSRDYDVTFDSPGDRSTTITGKIIDVRPSLSKHPVSLYFTRDHAEYWLDKSSEEVFE